MTATIPVAQYANIQPSFEVEGENYEAAFELGLQKLKYIWDRAGEKPLDIERTRKPKVTGDIMSCWASGTQVYFDSNEHIYRGADGKQWLGGSTFAGRYKSEFNGDLISKKVAEKHKVDAREILAMWELNAEASSTLGTAVHAALQLYGEYRELSKATKDGSVEAALTSNPVLRPIVEKFFEGREDEIAKYECFVADPARRHCGLIDRLKIDDDGGLWVEDYKTNADINKSQTILEPFKGLVEPTSLGSYVLQLSFYARILIAHGKTVKGLRIHHWNGERWDTYEREVIDLLGVLGG